MTDGEIGRKIQVAFIIGLAWYGGFNGFPALLWPAAIATSLLFVIWLGLMIANGKI